MKAVERAKKLILMLVVVTVVASFGFVVASANDPTSADAVGAMTTAFTGIAGDITGVIIVVLPIALGIFGLVIAVKFGINWFRTLVNKSGS